MEFDQIKNNKRIWLDDFEKGGFPDGTIRTHGGKKVKKVGGKWIPVGGDAKSKPDEDKQKKGKKTEEAGKTKSKPKETGKKPAKKEDDKSPKAEEQKNGKEGSDDKPKTSDHMNEFDKKLKSAKDDHLKKFSEDEKQHPTLRESAKKELKSRQPQPKKKSDYEKFQDKFPIDQPSKAAKKIMEEIAFVAMLQPQGAAEAAQKMYLATQLRQDHGWDPARNEPTSRFGEAARLMKSGTKADLKEARSFVSSYERAKEKGTAQKFGHSIDDLIHHYQRAADVIEQKLTGDYDDQQAGAQTGEKTTQRTDFENIAQAQNDIEKKVYKEMGLDGRRVITGAENAAANKAIAKEFKDQFGMSYTAAEKKSKEDPYDGDGVKNHSEKDIKSKIEEVLDDHLDMDTIYDKEGIIKEAVSLVQDLDRAGFAEDLDETVDDVLMGMNEDGSFMDHEQDELNRPGDGDPESVAQIFSDADDVEEKYLDILDEARDNADDPDDEDEIVGNAKDAFKEKYGHDFDDALEEMEDMEDQ